jgi:hypothetical protein
MPYRLAIALNKSMGRLMGIEPTNAGITIRCVNHFATTAIVCILAGVAGIEPASKVLETFVLPLNYTPVMVEGERLELPNPKERIYSPPRLANFATPPRLSDIFLKVLLQYFQIKMAVPTGIEPAISCVTGRHVNRYTTGPVLLK